LITTKGIPPLNHPEKYSDELRDFLKLCLADEHDDRPSATELLQHPWMKIACSGPELLPTIAIARESKEREEAEYSTSDSDTDDDDDSDDQL